MAKELRYFNLIFFILMVCINALANTIPLGKGYTGTISDQYPNLFTPAPITFSIWSVIYALVAFFIVYQFGVFRNESVGERFISLIGPWFVISCIMNIGWMFSWHYDIIWLSLIFMGGLLISLIMITMAIYPNPLLEKMGTNKLSIFAKLCIYAFDIYLGWIVAATIANISVFLVKINWNRFGFSDEAWTVIVLIVGALLGAMFIITRQKYMSALAIAWAYCGILIKHISQSGYGGAYPIIITTAIVCIFFILAVGLIRTLTTLSNNP